jgi:hypothetical protein
MSGAASGTLLSAKEMFRESIGNRKSVLSPTTPPRTAGAAALAWAAGDKAVNSPAPRGEECGEMGRGCGAVA